MHPLSLSRSLAGTFLVAVLLLGCNTPSGPLVGNRGPLTSGGMSPDLGVVRFATGMLEPEQYSVASAERSLKIDESSVSRRTLVVLNIDTRITLEALQFDPGQLTPWEADWDPAIIISEEARPPPDHP